MSKSEGEPDEDVSCPSPQSLVHHHEDGTVEFSVDSIHDLLVCHLCQGFYRDPYTTTNCRHTFCRSCLGTAIDAGCYYCLKCKTYVGQDISKFASPDYTLQHLMDRVLFPELAAEDAAREREFYARRGIAPKQPAEPTEILDASRTSSNAAAAAVNGSAATSNATRKRGRPRRYQDSKDVTFELHPHKDAPTSDSVASLPIGSGAPMMPPLEYPLLRTDGSVRVGQLKKYLLLKLDLKDEDEKREIEILCQGIPLGNELSVEFILRAVWMEPSKKLMLSYRYAFAV